MPVPLIRHPGLQSLLRKYKEQTFANEKNERALESEEEKELRARAVQCSACMISYLAYSVVLKNAVYIVVQIAIEFWGQIFCLGIKTQKSAENHIVFHSCKSPCETFSLDEARSRPYRVVNVLYCLNAGSLKPPTRNNC